LNNNTPFAQQHPSAPPGHTAINVSEIIAIYIGVASIPTPPTKRRIEIIDALEKVLLNFSASLNNGVPN